MPLSSITNLGKLLTGLVFVEDPDKFVDDTEFDLVLTDVALDGGFLKDDVRDTVGEGLPVDGLSFEEIATGCVEDPVWDAI